jgi:hypothetical protein
MKQPRHVHWRDYEVTPCAPAQLPLYLCDTMQLQSRQVNWHDFIVKEADL